MKLKIPLLYVFHHTVFSIKHYTNILSFYKICVIKSRSNNENVKVVGYLNSKF